MSQTWKIILAVIITAVVVGCGVAFWQQKNCPVYEFPDGKSNKNPFNSSKNDVILYQDNDYGVKFTTRKGCEDYYSVGVVSEKYKEKNYVKDYGVFVPGSKNWPKDSRWYYFTIYTPEIYYQFTPESLVGRPDLVFHLDSGELLTRWENHQDGPGDIPAGCFVDAEKF
ncbi:MAG TPA: hypothetical protein VJB41_03210 [Patescibacteria group bacterium]|nr:hypothetical protein [Patescibacteria group bacterium]